MRLPYVLKIGRTPREDVPGEDASKLRKRIHDIHQKVWSHIQIARFYMKEQYGVRNGEGHYVEEIWFGSTIRREDEIYALRCKETGKDHTRS